MRTIAYVDMYEFPLTVEEIHRYLVGLPASSQEVELVLGDGPLRSDYLDCRDGMFALRGRGEIIDTRRRRAEVSAVLWPIARHYGRLIASLPFVRMIAVTGSLAVDNSEPDADIDFFIVTESGRLWSCRAMVVLIVKAAARRGTALCPNYFLTERALAMQDRNLYVAHEVAQMVPVAGLEVYRKLREKNGWVADYLPNAAGMPQRGNGRLLDTSALIRGVRSWAERVLRTNPGERLERWEMKRKMRKFSQQAADHEAAFSADLCKGHFDNHSRRALELFAQNWRQLETESPEDQ